MNYGPFVSSPRQARAIMDGIELLIDGLQKLKLKYAPSLADLHQAIELEDYDEATRCMRFHRVNSRLDQGGNLALKLSVRKGAHDLSVQLLGFEHVSSLACYNGREILLAAIERYHQTQTQQDYQFILKLLNNYQCFQKSASFKANEVLAKVIEYGYEDLFEVLLNVPTIVNAISHGSNLALCTAARYNREKMLETLLGFKAVIQDFEFNHLVLKAAAQGGSVVIMQRLLKYPALASKISTAYVPEFRAPIYYATIANQLSMVQYLLTLPTVREKLFYGNFALLNAAAENGAIDVLKYFLTFKQGVAKLSDLFNGLHPMYGAIRNDHIEVVRYLLGLDAIKENLAECLGMARCAFLYRRDAILDLLFKSGVTLKGLTYDIKKDELGFHGYHETLEQYDQDSLSAYLPMMNESSVNKFLEKAEQAISPENRGKKDKATL